MKLRPFQEIALKTLENKHHLLCVAPTGSGKSLIFERWALRPNTRTVLFTPLVALGRQQVNCFEKGSSSDLFKVVQNGTQPPNSKHGVWVLSPEALQSSRTQEQLRQWQPDFMVVDECHCLWDWGDGFRPAFLLIPELLMQLLSERRPQRMPLRSIWLTATLPAQARADLKSRLPSVVLEEQGHFALPPNLHLSCAQVPLSSRAQWLIARLLYEKRPGIIFTVTRQGSERVARLLSAMKKRVAAYHAGMSSEERKNLENQIFERKIDVVVATSAFGMGMNFTHLEWVILWQTPPSLLALAQSVGRAGRSSFGRATAQVLYSDDDFRLLEWMLHGKLKRMQEAQAVHQFLTQPQCRSLALRKYFDGGESLHAVPCGQCDFCLARDATERASPSS